MISALQTIRLEHYNIHSVLTCLRYLVRQLEDGSWRPDFELLRSILRYMQEFPEALHHPKEERFLFSALLARKPEAAALVESLCNEHAEGLCLLADLEAALHAYRADRSALGRLRAAVDGYVRFQRDHMRREEKELIALALDALSADDWAGIDSAFANNRDPVFGANREQRYDALFRHILDLAPPPMGFGATDP